jgi:predicted ribosome quality control (RQC) complex YloA/Tae2 family protein
MQPIDAITLKHLSAEWQGDRAPNTRIVGTKITKVHHLGIHTFALQLWGSHHPVLKRWDRLLIHLHPSWPVASLVDADTIQNLVMSPFEKPTGFCMLLRKHLQNGRITSVTTLPDERVINLGIQNINELGQDVPLVLSLELMGKATNMVLIEADGIAGGTILGVAHTVSEGMSRLREVAVGLPYMAPPLPQAKIPTANLTDDHLTRWQQLMPDLPWAERLARQVQGLGRDLALGLADSLIWQPSTPAVQVLADLQGVLAGQNLAPVVHSEGAAFRLVAPKAPDEHDWLACDSVTELIHRHGVGALLNQQRHAWQRVLHQALQKHIGILAKQLADWSPPSPDEIAQSQQWADTLLVAYSSHQLPPTPTDHHITLPDLTTGVPVTIPIRPELGWSDNAQAHYRRAQKGRAKWQRCQAEQARLTLAQDQWREWLVWVAQATSLSELKAMAYELQALGMALPGLAAMTTKKPGAGKKPALADPVRRLTSSDGITLLVGKSGHGNALVVGSLSRADDVWLHAHNLPGSHVVIVARDLPKAPNGSAQIPDATLLEAAQLAVYYSSARHGKNVPVIYTPIRHVRKIPGSYPGHVQDTHEQGLFVTVAHDFGMTLC